jgi:2-hydroxychromene-2-carboxylate isomerase
VVYHSHVLEHLPKDAAPRFVGECYRVLAEGGILRVVVPDLDIQDPKIMVEVANQSGLKGDALLEKSKDPAIQVDIDHLTQEAVKRQVFGTPFFFYRDEPFWGQDRLDMLEDMIRSNREPIAFKIIESA